MATLKKASMRTYYSHYLLPRNDLSIEAEDISNPDYKLEHTVLSLF
jgi:hypothetical protein